MIMSDYLTTKGGKTPQKMIINKETAPYKQDEATHAGSSSFLFLPKKHCDERLRSYRKLSTFSLQNSPPGGIGTRNWNFSANSYFEDRSIAVLQKLKDK